MRLADGEGRLLACDGETPGELQVRGPWTAGAYFKHEGESEEFTRDGWFRTGDVATITPVSPGFFTSNFRPTISVIPYSEQTCLP